MPTRRQPVAIAPGVARDRSIAISTGSVMLTDDPDGVTTVWVNGVPSSTMHRDPDMLVFEYMRHIAAAVAAWEAPSRMLALHVGAGICTVPRCLAATYPDSRHIAVDIDVTLTELARQWWDLPRAPRLRIRQQDGLDALRSRADDSLDLVVRDAFHITATPPELADEDWWAQARRVVRPDGLAVANMSAVPGHRASRDDVHAARTAFRQVVAVGEGAVLKGRRRGNVVLVAGSRVDVDALRTYAASAPLPTSVDDTWLT